MLFFSSFVLPFFEQQVDLLTFLQNDDGLLIVEQKLRVYTNKWAADCCNINWTL